MHFYKRFEPKILRSTVNWRVYDLVNKNIIQRVGKGKFRLEPIISFVPELNTKHFKINALIKTQFPFANYCIWDTSVIKEFSQHISKTNFTLVDVEKGVEESVYLNLKETFKQVFLKPGVELLNNYIGDLNKAILVRTLVSEAPIKELKNVPVASLEKILVDIFSDKEFDYLKGSELGFVFIKAFERYTINESKMIRYADRKRKKEEIIKFLKDQNLKINDR